VCTGAANYTMRNSLYIGSLRSFVARMCGVGGSSIQKEQRMRNDEDILLNAVLHFMTRPGSMIVQLIFRTSHRHLATSYNLVRHHINGPFAPSYV
jgi:hypothetical protein